MKKSGNLNNSGFTLIEVMVAMFCLGIATLLLLQGVQLMRWLSLEGYQSEDYIAIKQLRLVLAQSYERAIQQDTLCFRFHGENSRLEFHNQRLVKREGYEIFLKDIDEVEFYEEGNCYAMQWKRGTHQKKAILVCE